MNVLLHHHLLRALRPLFMLTCIFIFGNISAQFSDSFQDGNFTLNPTWNGNTENFIINASNELQLTDLDPVVTQSYLSTPSAFLSLSDLEWRIKIKQSFSGSDANQSRIYLTSDQAVLSYSSNNSAGVHGYFLKLGEGLSGDVVRFYKDDGTSISLIASCTTPISNSFEIRIKVTRDAAGGWSIAIDPLAGENFVEEANFTETTFNTSSYFGMVCTYTSSNATKFYFDDIYSGPEILDTTPPALLSATATSDTTLDLLFDEALDIVSAENELFYTVAGVGSPVSAIRETSNSALVHLTFGTTFNLNEEYTIEVSNIEDENGNPLNTASTDFMWYILGTATFRDVVFNEIMADPTPPLGLPDVEFVEIHNTHATNTYDLDGWIFVNSTTDKFLPHYLLPPGGYLVLCDVTDVEFFNSGIEVLGIPSFTALTNSEDSLTLKSWEGIIVDMVEYSDDWYDTPEGLNGGRTLELINPILPCQNQDNWAESTNENGGTPGAANSVLNTTPDTNAPNLVALTVLSSTDLLIEFNESMDTTGFTIPTWNLNPFNSISNASWNPGLNEVHLTPQFPVTAPNMYQLFISGIGDCSGNMITPITLDFTLGFAPTAGDLIINEIMADPDLAIQMPASEYVEIRNNSDHLLDISHIKLNSGYFTSQVLLEPDSFLVIANVNNANLFNGFSNTAFMTSFPALTNSGGSIDLTNEAEETLDHVEYALNWYHDNTKLDGGWSMERINPFANCSGAYNWRASVDARGGTAGEENSVYNTTSNGAPSIINFGFLNETQIYIRFSESMDVNSVSNMNLTFSPGSTLGVPVWNSDLDLLILFITTPIVLETTYTLNLTGLTDCDGNMPNVLSLQFVKGIEPTPGDIIINEILADGTSEDQVSNPSPDFVEIHNLTSHIVELTHVKINTGFFEKQILLQPDSFIVVTDADNSPINFFSIPGTAFMNNFPALTEFGTAITLSTDDDILDYVEYTKNFYHNPDAEDGGYSMERINPLDPCSSTDNWHACTNPSGTSAGKRNSVYDISPDVLSPQLIYILGDTQDKITLYFNEPISETSFADLDWFVNGQHITNANPTLVGDENNAVRLEYGEMNPGATYTFVLSGIADCWGNVITALEGRFGLAEEAQVGDIIINEILYNPKDGGADFVEVYNKSNRILSMKDWSIADATNGEMNTPDVITTENILCFPGEYLVFTKESGTLPAFYPSTHTDRVWEVLGISDFSSRDEVFILTPDQNVSDHFIYDESLQYQLLNSYDGVSLERISFNRATNDITNWHSASETSGFATPGYLNSQSELEMGTDDSFVVETEIFSPDNDGYKDVTTFSYRMDEPGYTGDIRIYDSEGRFVRHLMKNELLGSTGSISWDGFSDEKQKASIGIYVIYFEAFNPSGSTVKSKKTCVLAHPLN